MSIYKGFNKVLSTAALLAYTTTSCTGVPASNPCPAGESPILTADFVHINNPGIIVAANTDYSVYAGRGYSAGEANNIVVIDLLGMDEIVLGREYPATLNHYGAFTEVILLEKVISLEAPDWSVPTFVTLHGTTGRFADGDRVNTGDLQNGLEKLLICGSDGSLLSN